MLCSQSRCAELPRCHCLQHRAAAWSARLWSLWTRKVRRALGFLAAVVSAVGFPAFAVFIWLVSPLIHKISLFLFQAPFKEIPPIRNAFLPWAGLLAWQSSPPHCTAFQLTLSPSVMLSLQHTAARCLCSELRPCFAAMPIQARRLFTARFRV